MFTSLTFFLCTDIHQLGNYVHNCIGKRKRRLRSNARSILAILECSLVIKFFAHGQYTTSTLRVWTRRVASPVTTSFGSSSRAATLNRTETCDLNCPGVISFIVKMHFVHLELDVYPRINMFVVLSSLVIAGLQVCTSSSTRKPSNRAR